MKCNSCNVENLTPDDFYKPKNRKHEPWCIQCRKKWQKKYNAKAKKCFANAPLSTDSAVAKWIQEHPINRKAVRASILAIMPNIHEDFYNTNSFI
jgi:hypothetical protein